MKMLFNTIIILFAVSAVLQGCGSNNVTEDNSHPSGILFA